MVAVPSTMLPLGTRAPTFTLPDTISEEDISLSQFQDSKGYLIMFLCNHCPFVKHIQPEISKIGKEYSQKGITILAISSNDVDHYPEDSPPKMTQEAKDAGYTFPYLYDESQNVAKAYKAACTPDFYLFDENKLLVYRGQLDDSRPGNNTPLNGHSLRQALNALLDGTPMDKVEQKPSIGCNIKWKTGNAPEYFNT